MILKRFFVLPPGAAAALRTGPLSQGVASNAAAAGFSTMASSAASWTKVYSNPVEMAELKFGAGNVRTVKLNAMPAEMPMMLTNLNIAQQWTGVDNQQQEYDVRELPAEFRDKLSSVIPSDSITTSPINVITVTYKTTNNMEVWNAAVKSERRQLAKDFSSEARQVAEILKNMGYWVEFIDPSTGKAALSPAPGSGQLIETDEFYTHFGYSIRSKSCCRVLSHDTWGTHAFVGTMFTNAPSTIIDQCLLGRFSA